MPAFKNLYATKVKGGALYVAILVSIIIGIILCMFILIANYNQRQVTVYATTSQLYYNLKSAFELAQSDYFTDDKNDQWIKNITNDDSLKIKKMYWGGYIVLAAQTKNRHQQIHQSGIYGVAMPADTGLMISDNGRPVGLSGFVDFKANCFLSKAGIKATFIEGQSFAAGPQTMSFIKTAPPNIPFADKEIMAKIKLQQTGISNYSDSLVAQLPTVLNHSFKNKTIVYETTANKLEQLALKNNIKIIAKNIEIDSSCKFENVLIVCNKIKFKEGFKGKVHVIASDSIITEKKCTFNYPSSFVLMPVNNKTNTLKCIYINEDCIFYGGILALNNNYETDAAKVFIKLNKTCEVNGFIYSANYLHLEGKLCATIISDKLLLNTPSAVYENHLLACEIDPKKYAHMLAIPQIFKKTAHLLCCQKIN